MTNREPPLDPAQQAAVDSWAGPLLLVGGPGSGKTTTLVAAALATLRDAAPGGPQPLLLTFSRRAASGLRNRVVRGLGRTTTPPLVMTVHAFCLWLHRRFTPHDQPELRLLTAPEQEFRVRELLVGGGVGRWPAALAQASGTRAFAAQVRAALARARQLGLDPEDLAGMGAAADRPEWAALGHFFDEYLDVLDGEGALDYAELVHRSRILLNDPPVLREVRRLVGDVLVDEYQELDPSQIGLLRALVPPGGRILAAGDPDQAMFRFRGAHPRGMADFSTTFTAADGSPAPVALLAGSHRYGPGIAAAVTRVAARLPLPPLGPAAGPVLRPASPGPVTDVDVIVSPTEGAQGQGIADALLRAHQDDGIPFGDMAVLVRSGRRQLAGIARSLAGAGVPVEVAGDEIPLSQELAVRPLLLAIEVILEGRRCDPDQARRLLGSPLAALDAIGLRALARQLQEVERAAYGQPITARPGAQLIAAAIAEPELLDDAPDTAEVAALRCFSALLRAGERALEAPGAGPGEVLWALWSGTGWPERLLADSRAGGELGRQADRALDAVKALFDAAAATGQPAGPGGVRGFLAEVEGQEIPADTEREAEVLGRGVRVLTVHRAKGRQWPLAVIAGVQEGIWPDPGRAGALLHPDELVSHGLVGVPDFRAALADERRLFVVACSRARRRLIVTAVEGSDGEANQPSRFLAELGVPARLAPPGDRPLTLAALVGELRRAATDPQAGDVVRRAAAVRLAALAVLTDDGGRPLAPQAHPDRWWGVLEPTQSGAEIPERIRLSATQLSGLLECPRQYFLSRRAHADEARSGAAGLGSVIHVLAEHARTDGLAAEELSEELDRVWGSIPFEAAWMSSGERVEAELALTRFLVWHEAHDHAEVLGVEVPFQVEVEVDGEPVTLTGAVDRLELAADGRLRIIDFKTGRRLPTRAQVEVAEQVGLYQLAADEGAFAALAGPAPSGGGVLVYLRQADGGEDFPKQLHQAALSEKPHPSTDPEAAAYPTWVHHRIAKAARIVRQGRYPATPGDGCRWCPFTNSCPGQPGGGQVVR